MNIKQLITRILLRIIRNIRVDRFLPDKLYLSMLYYKTFGKSINWNNPKTFNEKLQWLKLYNRNPEYTIMVDKIKAKDWVAERIGEEHIIPTLGVWNTPDEIDFDSLPNQFVLKCNHNSGIGMYICKDKSKMDVEAVKKELWKGLKHNFYLQGREWPYKDIPRKILAEKYITPDMGHSDLLDFKFYCFDGIPKLIMVAGGRDSGDKRFAYYDTEWNPIDIQWGAPKPDKNYKKPEQLQHMLEIASCLAKKLPHVRIDLYCIDNNILFGEITMFDASGFETISPYDFDIYLGNLIRLPDMRMGGNIKTQ